MINNELFDEIVYISNRNKIIDKNLMLKIIISSVLNTDPITINFFKGIDFNYANNKGYACEVNGIIGINYIKILEEANRLRRGGQNYLKINLMIVHHLLHEIQHLRKQYKISKNDFEAALLYCSQPIFTCSLLSQSMQLSKFKKKLKGLTKEQYKEIVQKKERKFYDMLYDINPSERIANVDASKILFTDLQDYSKYNSEISDICADFYNYHIKYLKAGYRYTVEGLSIKLKEYFINLDGESILERFSIYSKNDEEFLKNSLRYFDLEDRFKFGLPVTEKDVDKLYKKLM